MSKLRECCNIFILREVQITLRLSPPLIFFLKNNIVMLHDRDEALREALKRSDESKEKLFESWIIDSEEKGASLEDQARHTDWEDDEH